MSTSEQSRHPARRGRAAAWLLLVALAVGCSSPVPSDEAGTESDVATAETPTPEEADPDGRTPDVPELGTAADRLDATVVELTPADGEGQFAPALVDARVAADDAARAQGLMGVDPLPDGAGMLFVYPDERTGAFWMKDTLVPLDIAFIAADGTVRAVLTMEPCAADPCPIYDPRVEYLAALEVPAGWFATNDIDVGAEARWAAPVAAEPVPHDAAGQ